MSGAATRTLRLGYSPCPNDAFIFYALAHGLVHDGREPEVRFDIALDDVEALNRAADRGELDVAKVSYHAYGYLADRYVMLRAGGALGRGVGPLIVTREALDDLAGKSIAIPGGRTTANLLLRLSQPSARLREMRYDRIMPAVAAGEVDAGLIIHESRFTYPDHGLRCFLDLGTWWEEATGELVPLGGIVARRDLGSDLLLRIQAMLRASLTYAWENPGATRTYVAQHAQEMDESVRQRHIDLYVNRYSLEVGPDGVRAAETLLRRGVEQGLFPPPREPLFLPDVHRT
jgi:1,4-dihydroxy-6-naphthoate synthase